MAKLDAKNRSLYFVQPAIPARLAADIFFRLSMIPQNAQTRRAFRRIGHDHARIATRAQILGWVKTKASDVAQRTGTPALVACANGLRAVFDHLQVLLAREVHDRVHVRSQTVEVNDDDGASARSHAARNLRRVDVVSVGMNVREDRFRSQRAHGAARGDKGERRENDFVAGRDSAGTQRENQRIRAGADTDAMRHTAKLCDFFFQRSAFTPEDELLRGEHALDRLANFAANRGVLCRQIKLWDGAVSGCQWIRAHAANNPGRGSMRMNSRTRGELFLRKFRAKSDGIVWIDGAGLFFHRLDHTFFVDDESGALRPIIFFFLDVVHFQDAVLFQHLAVHVAEQREGDADFLRESVVGGGTVNADAENDCIGSFELGHISLIGLKFFRSTFGEGQDVKGQDDIFLTAILTQVDLLPLVVEKRKVRSHVAGLQRGVREFDVLLRASRAGDPTARQRCRNDDGL